MSVRFESAQPDEPEEGSGQDATPNAVPPKAPEPEAFETEAPEPETPAPETSPEPEASSSRGPDAPSASLCGHAPETPPAAGAQLPSEPHWKALSELTARAEANRAALSELHAERAEICAAAVELVDERVAQRKAGRIARLKGEIGDEIPLREVIAELATALRVTEQTVRGWLSDGHRLVHTLPDTLDALRTGRIDDRQAAAIVDGITGLDEDHHSSYQQQLLDAADQQTAAGLRKTAKIVAARLQPDLVDEHHKRVYDDRRIRAISFHDGSGRLHIDGPAPFIFAVYDRVTKIARALPTHNENSLAEGEDPAEGAGGPAAILTALADERTLDQRRFDVTIEQLLIGTPSAQGDPDLLGAIRGEIQVTIPVLTLAGQDNEPALLAGHGPIDADTARRLAGNAPGWDRILTHPTTGLPLATDRYRPTKKQRRYLKARDPHCRWPGCRRAAVHCDDEHNIPYSEGGKTCVCNMCEFCRRHHVIKHASPWQIINHGAGNLEFISPTGRRYRNNAPPMLEHVTPTWTQPFITTPDDPAPF